MRTFISKVVLIMLVVTVFVTGSAIAATDTTAPSISISKASGSTIEAGSSFSFEIRDNESYITSTEYYWANNDASRTMADGTKKVSLSNLVNRNPYYGVTPKAPTNPGEYKFCIKAQNGAGLLTSDEYTYYILGDEDTTAPVITANPVSGSTVELNSKVVVKIKDSESKIVEVSYDINGIHTKANGTANYDWVININAFNLAKTYTVTVNAKNEEGIESTETFIYYVKASEETDTEVPTVEASLVNDTVVSVIVKDNKELQSIKYSWDSTTDYKDLANVSGKSYTFKSSIPDTTKTHVLRVIAIDAAGNEMDFEYTIEIKIETPATAPVITANYASGSTIDLLTTVTFTIKDSGSKIVEASYDCNGIYQKVTNAANYEWKINLTNFNLVQKYTVVIIAKNANGVETTETFIYYVRGNEDNDDQAPTVTASITSGSTVITGKTVTVTTKDNKALSSVKYSWDSTTNYTYVSNVSGTVHTLNTTIPTTVGTHTLRVVAVDAAGNETKKDFVYTVKTETPATAPVITANYASGSTIDLLTTVTFTIKDSGSKIVEASYDCNGIYQKVTNAANYEWKINLTNFNLVQKYTVVIIAKNAIGAETTETFTYYVRGNEDNDDQAPTVTANITSGSTVTAGQTVTVTLRDNKELKSGKYSWDSTTNYTSVSNVSGTVRTFNTTVPTTVGTHTLRVVAIDAAGNESGVKTFSYYVEDDSDTQAPTIKANPSSGNIKPTADITITANDDKDLMTLRYSWDDGVSTTKTIAGKTYVMSVEAPATAGEHILHVIVIDRAGNRTEKDFTYNVIDDQIPTITMTPGDKSTVVGGKVIRATLRDDSELATVKYNWKGKTATTESISGTYKVIELPAISSTAGTYYMYITVTDATGNSTEGIYTYYVKEDEEDSGDIPTVDADPSKGTLEYGDRITITAEDDDGIDYVEYYWDDDDVSKKYSDKFTVKVPSDEGKHYLYVRATDEKGNRCSYERFTYTIEENNYPGNPDIIGDLNKKVKELRVEIRNGDDKIKFEPEEEILYYVDYYNGSSSKISNAKIVVDLPTYLEGIEASDSGKVSSNKVVWNLGTLNKGEYGRLSFTAQYTSEKYNEKIITVPAKIYAGSSLKDTSTVRNLIYCEDASGSGSHVAYCVGYPSGAFRPNGNITRAELATMVANIEGISSTYRGQFTDVQGHWAADKIQACVERGYMNGVGYNYFGAEQYATRADLAYAIAAILGVEDLEPVFVYSSDVAYSDARCAMEQLLRLGIMDGYADGTSKPEKNITRAEAVTIINNYLFRGELYTRGYNYSYNYNTNYNYGGNSYILQFTDLTSSHWAYGHIMEATNNHRYVRTIDGNEEML